LKPSAAVSAHGAVVNHGIATGQC